ncbi:recombinase family protein [Achromobacter insolitus]|uniref:recombinase family protein n=1 Tax=Achromobacter insolitus TaxID=217204 RepID=UPI000AE3BAED|nr:recombinase family protein [Achromobacter insolitus]
MKIKPIVYSYLRFSDPKQAAGSSADRQIEYAKRWASEHGMALDSSLSLRDEGLSAYHQRHVKQGALGVFLRAVEDGHIPEGSVLIVEGLDRLSRAEPIQAQAQLAQIVNSGITVVTASDGREYNRESLKRQPMDLVYSLLVMIRAHEESDTKSKRVKAAIRRQCQNWLAGTWKGQIRNGKDPHWVAFIDGQYHLVPDRVSSLRLAFSMFKEGHGAVSIMRHLTANSMKVAKRRQRRAELLPNYPKPSAYRREDARG